LYTLDELNLLFDYLNLLLDSDFLLTDLLSFDNNLLFELDCYLCSFKLAKLTLYRFEFTLMLDLSKLGDLYSFIPLFYIFNYLLSFLYYLFIYNILSYLFNLFYLLNFYYLLFILSI